MHRLCGNVIIFFFSATAPYPIVKPLISAMCFIQNPIHTQWHHIAYCVDRRLTMTDRQIYAICYVCYMRLNWICLIYAWVHILPLHLDENHTCECYRCNYFLQSKAVFFFSPFAKIKSFVYSICWRNWLKLFIYH